MTKIHRDLVNSERHLPKDFEDAANESAMIKDVDGSLKWRALSDLGDTGPQGPQGPDASAIQDIVVVQKSPGPDQFSDPIAAMASILDASPTKPYVLQIGPGIYSLSEPLVIKGNVTVKVNGHGSVILEPADPDNDVVKINQSTSRLQGVTIRGATGANAAGIRITDVSTLISICDIVTVLNCTESVVIESTTKDIQAVFRNLRLISSSITKKLLRIQSNGGFQSIVRIYSAILTDDDGTLFEDAILLTGAGVRLDANTVLARSTVGSGNGIRINNGAELVSQSGAEIEGFDKNLFAENSGTAPTIRTTTVMLRNGVTADLDIEHPGTMGAGLFKANVSTKVFVDDDAPIKLRIDDPSPESAIGVFLRGEIIQADKFSQQVNISKLGRAASTMGVYSGGVLSDGGGLNVGVSIGSGFCLDAVDKFVREVFWESATLVLLPLSVSYIYVTSSGVVSQASTLPDTEENIILGRVATFVTEIHFIESTPILLSHIGNKIAAFNREAFGPIYNTGSQVSENGSTARALDISPGIYWFGTNRFAPSGGQAVEFFLFYRDGLGEFNVISEVTQVTNTQYDDNSGALVAIPAGKFVKHSLYLIGDGDNEQYSVVTGQAIHDTLIEAEASNLALPPISFDDAMVLIATIIVEEGNPALRIYDARPTPQHRASGLSASSFHDELLDRGNADAHPQLLNRDGSKAMSGNLNMGGQNITNVGQVDGVDVSNHAARHLPNGVDPIAVATAVLGGLMSAVDKVKFDTIQTGATQNDTDANLRARSTHTGTQLASTISDFSTAVNTIITALKGAANGLAPLNASSLIDAIYLPSFVDDVLEFADLASFPVTGETGKIYVALDSNKTYRWSGSVYTEISPSEVNSVNGFTGIITLLTTHINEGTNLYFTDARARAALSILAPLAYNSTTGQFSIPAASGPSTNGYMQGVDKVKLDRLATGFLQYVNSTDQTVPGATFQAILFQNNINSFANTYLTKASNTEFQSNFEGRVEIAFSAYFYAGANNRRGQFQLYKNGNPIAGTLTQASAKGAATQGQQVSIDWIEPVAVDDLLEMRFAAPDGSAITIPVNLARMQVKVYSLGLT
jgi:hypothetical protein